MQQAPSVPWQAETQERGLFDHPIIQFLFFAIVFSVPFYRWRHLSADHEFLKVDWLLVVILMLLIGPYILVQRRFPQRLRNNLWPWMLLFFLVNIASSLLTIYPEAIVSGLQKLFFGYIFIALTLLIVGRRGVYTIFPVVFCTAVVLGAMLAILGYYLQVDWLTVGVTTGVGESAMRGAGGSIGANNSALLYLFCMPILVHWIHHGRNHISRLWAVAQIVILLLGMIATFSRGGFLILIFVVGLILFEERRRFHPRLLGPMMVLLGASIIVGTLAVPDSFVDRIKSLSQGTQADAAMSRRAAYLKVGWQIFKEHPMLGTGTDTFKYNWFDSDISRYYEHEMRYAHNTYMEVLVGSGIIGLILFLAILVRALANYSQSISIFRAHGDEKMASLATAYRISFIGIITYLLVLSAIEHKLFLLSLAFAQLCLRCAEEAGECSAPEAPQPADLLAPSTALPFSTNPSQTAR